MYSKWTYPIEIEVYRKSQGVSYPAVMYMVTTLG